MPTFRRDLDSAAGMRLVTLLVRALLVALATAGAARADGPGPRPAPRGMAAGGVAGGMAADWDEPAPGGGPDILSPSAPAGRVRPVRRVTGGPDYVGSDYGLGKPAYFGLGSRPDWGRSSTD